MFRLLVSFYADLGPGHCDGVTYVSACMSPGIELTKQGDRLGQLPGTGHRHPVCTVLRLFEPLFCARRAETIF